MAATPMKSPASESKSESPAGRKSADVRTGKRRRRTRGISAYWKAFFEQRPHLLAVKGNDEAFAYWLKEHANVKEVPPSVRQGLANVKSSLRKDLSGANERGVARTYKQRTRGLPLQQLEESIDDCLAMAKNLDSESLRPVIELLRNARNVVVRSEPL